MSVIGKARSPNYRIYFLICLGIGLWLVLFWNATKVVNPNFNSVLEEKAVSVPPTSAPLSEGLPKLAVEEENWQLVTGGKIAPEILPWVYTEFDRRFDQIQLESQEGQWSGFADLNQELFPLLRYILWMPATHLNSWKVKGDYYLNLLVFVSSNPANDQASIREMTLIEEEWYGLR